MPFTHTSTLAISVRPSQKSEGYMVAYKRFNLSRARDDHEENINQRLDIGCRYRAVTEYRTCSIVKL